MSDVKIEYFNEWPYEEALLWMQQARNNVVESKKIYIGFGTHKEKVITLGRNAAITQVYALDKALEKNILIKRTDRGGGATYHGPGQLVIYPVLSLPLYKLQIAQYVCLLEKSIINVLESYNINAYQICKKPGVYVDNAKIASIGLNIHKGIVTHGISLNIQNDLSYYELFAPCGEKNMLITSVKEHLDLSNFDIRLFGLDICKYLFKSFL
jgi:lipoate-protein ligase B